MLEKTKGIVLRSFKYNDKSNIVSIFTEKFGKKSFIVFGINSQKKGKILRSTLQPLNLINIEFYNKSNTSLSKIKELTLAYPYKTISIDFYKKTILLFLSEVIYKVLIENFEDKNLFDFIWNSLILFDLYEKDYSNFHVAFLTNLTKFLGIQPINNFSDINPFFNIKEAKFISSYQTNYSLNYELSQIFSQILNTKMSDFEQIKLNRTQRQQLLDFIIKYYTFHLENFDNINSYKIFKEIFNN